MEVHLTVDQKAFVRDAIESGRLKKGDLALFAAVGAGYTVGASLWRWAF